MTGYETQRERLIELVATAKNQRLMPGEASRKLANALGLTTWGANEIIKRTIAEGALVYAYREPISYVELPRTAVAAGTKPRTQ